MLIELLKRIDKSKDSIISTYYDLHNMPEKAWEEVITSKYLSEALQRSGFKVIKNVAGTTGILGIISGAEPGPVYAVRADMDALQYNIDGKDVNIHACGHDAHCTMVLHAAQEIARLGIKRGTLKIVFQPAEEVLKGAESMINSGLLSDVNEMIGIHLRPIQEAKMGEATAALLHGASCIISTKIKGIASHGARPHLGVNTIDAAAAVVNAVNAIKLAPTTPYSVKTTRLIAGGTANNIIPAQAEMAFDLRAQNNQVMDQLIRKTTNAIEYGAATVGATTEIQTIAKVPGAEYSDEMVKRVENSIRAILGKVLDPIVTPGGEDFHYYSIKGKIKTAYIGLGADLVPGLHHPDMKFDLDALLIGTKIIVYNIYNRLIK